jgi:bifunctional UDP-N-acetylglucosamine pyrophosphorylase/glucosamine-1-phosphate N-acetyltransferase
MTTERNSKTRAVVLAAGQGKRMKTTRAKVLHEVLGKPILTRILGALDKLGLEKIHVVIGHEGEQIIDFLSKHPPATPYETHWQKPQLGTGHALQQVTAELPSFNGTLLVTVGDAPLVTPSTLSDLLSMHHNEKAAATLLTTCVDDPKNYGRIVRDSGGKISAIVEDKDASEEQKGIREINPAIYCFAWPLMEKGLNSLKNDNRQKEYYLTDLIRWAHDQKLPLSGLVAEDWREVSAVNSRQELADVVELMRDRVVEHLLREGVTIVDPKQTWIAPEVEIGPDTMVLPGCYLTGDVKIGGGCQIGPHTVITGPVRIGDRTSVIQSHVVNSTIGSDCRVGPFAHMREHAEIDDHCRVGNFVEIKKSTIGSSTNVSHLSYVGDATLGSKVNIGAGTITANYDHYTGKKQRTTIEDGASTGSNSVLVAPISIGKESSVAAGTVANKNVPDGALAVGRVRQENKEGWAQRKRSKK